MSFRHTIAAAALLAGSAGTTFAADLPSRGAPQPVPVFAQTKNWTGFWLGAYAGYHHGNIEQFCVGLCPVNPNLTGFLGGINGGYDVQLANNIVLGVFANVPLVRLQESFTLAPGLTFKTSTRYAAFAAGRVGYAMGNLLPYIFAGYGFAEMRTTSPFAAPINKTHEGFVAGAGLEYAFTERWSADLRYTYTRAPKKLYDFGGGPEKFGQRGHTYQVGINYRFGGSPVAVVAKY